VGKTFFAVLSRLSESKHLKAVRDGIIAVLPLIIVGSFFLLAGQLPGAEPKKDWSSVEFFLNRSSFTHSVFHWYVLNHAIFLTPYILTMDVISLYVAFSTAAALAKLYQFDPISNGLMGAGAFLLTLVPQNMGKAGLFLSLKEMGGTGLFLAIVFGIVSVEVYRFWKKIHVFKLPETVPPAVLEAFYSMLPFLSLCTGIWILRDLLGINLQAEFLVVLKPIETLGDTLTAVILINLIIQVIWFMGVRGEAVVFTIMLPLWLVFLQKNANAVAAGHPAPYITAFPFYQWFVWIGGTGTTLGLCFLLLMSRSKTLKSIGKLGIIPSLCNINEPVVFGIPIVLNPILFVPFIIAPVSSGILAYLAFQFHFVHRPYLWVPWTLPSPIGAFLACGYDWRALVLNLVILFVSTAIYFPFFKQIEKKYLEEESQSSSH
jgi:PTS system cellobiose-specific IIC component